MPYRVPCVKSFRDKRDAGDENDTRQTLTGEDS